MINWLLILSIIISCVNTSPSSIDDEEYNKRCNAFSGIRTFSSQLRFCGNSLIKNVQKLPCSLIEENVVNGKRGKLIIKYPSEKFEIYYSASDPSSNLIIGKNYTFEMIQNLREREEYKDIAYVHHFNDMKIVGPIALLFENFQKDDELSQNYGFTYEKTIKYRGINAYSCESKTKSKNGKETKVKAIYQDLKSSTISEPRILALQYYSDNRLVSHFDYFKFSINNQMESIWKIPAIGSFGFADSKPPLFSGTGIHEVTLENLNKDYHSIEKVDTFYDSNQELLRVDNSRTGTQLIYNAKARLIYKIEDGICSRELIKIPGNKAPQDIAHLQNLLEKLDTGSHFFKTYLGQEIVQDAICDVWQKTRIEDTGENFFDRKVESIYIKHKSDPAEDDAHSFPLKYSQTLFEFIDNKFVDKSESHFNLLNYQQLYYNQNYRKIFQTKYCNSDLKNNLYLTILAQCKFFPLPVYAERFRFYVILQI